MPRAHAVADELGEALQSVAHQQATELRPFRECSLQIQWPQAAVGQDRVAFSTGHSTFLPNMSQEKSCGSIGSAVSLLTSGTTCWRTTKPVASATTRDARGLTLRFVAREDKL
jgi:hypothetical protein